MASYSDTMPPRLAATWSLWGYVKAGASALVLGAAFGGGLLLGASDDEELPVEEGAPLAAADASTEKLEAVREKLRLAFHQELTGAPRAAPEGPAITNTQAKPAAAPPAPSAAAASTTADTPAAAPAAEEASSGTEPPEPAPVVEKPAVAVAAEDADDGEAPAPDEDEEMIAAPPKAETEEDRTRVARAIAKVLGDDALPSAPAVVEQAKALAPAAEKATFAVQIASTPSEDGAKALVERLRAQGHAAGVVKADIEGKGAMFRVRVGGFSSRDAAAAYQAKLGEGFVIAE